MTELKVAFQPQILSVSTGKVNIQLAKPVLNRGVIRPDAELVQTYTYDRLIVEDEGVTLPSYSTSQVRLKDTVTLYPYVRMNDDYLYFIDIRCLSIPIYSIDTTLKGRVEYGATNHFYELIPIEAGRFKALGIDTSYDLNTLFYQSANGITRMLYWSSDNVIDLYNASAYGIWQGITNPMNNDPYWVIKSPMFYLRGNANYFTETYYNALTDIRFQYVIDVWRVAKESLNLEGWAMRQELLHIVDCANSHNRKLT